MNESPWSVVQASITRLNDKVSALPSVREATVAAAVPLSVMFDTDTVPTLVYGTLVAGLQPGNRVLTIRLRHYIWVVGLRGGPTVSWGDVAGKPTTFPPGAIADSDMPARLRITAMDISSKDLNGYRDTGFYRGVNMVNAPTANWYYVEVIRHDSASWCYQRVTGYGPVSGHVDTTWERWQSNGVWQPWRRVGSNTAVTNIANLPTGGNLVNDVLYVEEVSGSFRWTGSKWTPRTLGGSIPHASMTVGNASGIYWTTNYAVTFAVPFDNPPAVYPGESNASQIQWPILHSVTTTGFEFRILKVGSQPGTGTFYWRADAR